MSGVVSGPTLRYADYMTDDAVAPVRAFIGRLAPGAVCDDCVAHRLEIPALDASYASRELTGTAGFERDKGECSLCGATKEVTRLKARS
jgi:hypothetical protein